MNDASEQLSPANETPDGLILPEHKEAIASETTPEESIIGESPSEEIEDNPEQEAKAPDHTEPYATPQTPQRKQKSRLSKVTQNTSIVNNEASLGNRLKEFRENANVSIADLCKRLSIQSSIIQDLENGDYESLSHSFKNSNSIFLVATIKDICNELGVSKNQTDELVDLYYDEVANSGLPLNDTRAIQIADRTENEDEDSHFPVGDKEPIIKKLPKILVFLLLLFIVLFIFVSIIMPYVKVVRKPTTQRNLDIAPLIAPEKSPPIQLELPY